MLLLFQLLVQLDSPVSICGGSNCRLDEAAISVRTTEEEPPVENSLARWTGRALTALPVAFMVFDAALKFIHPSFVTEASKRIGFPDDLNLALGVIVTLAVVLYLVPRTATLGAVLLTGYLGGAVAIHLRIDDPLFSHTLFPAYVGAMLWAGLVLRDARVRRLVTQ
jgi:hypothetical protein